MDLGLPITAGGVEYFMVDRMFMRSPVYSGRHLTGYRALGVELEMHQILQMLESQMTEEERFSMTAMMAVNEGIWDRRSNTQMIAEGTKQYEARLDALEHRGVALRYRDADGNLIEDPLEVTLGGQLQFHVGSELHKKGAAIDHFDVCANAFSVRKPRERVTVLLGKADRQHGFLPADDFQANARPQDKPSPDNAEGSGGPSP